jgi:hypothetical protein
MPRSTPKGRKRSASDEQGWWMLVFESLSAGVLAILIAATALLVLVGAYDYIVWPLTKWDLASINVEQFRPWWQWAVGVTFAAGSATGFWCFSGAAFRPKPATRQRSGETHRSAAARRSVAQRDKLRRQNQKSRDLFNP